MYIGRIVSIGMTESGKAAAMYRVSSRSFPNREARKNDNSVSIMPRAGFEDDLNKNPYIAYNCIRLAKNYAIATNGSHTDPITEKIESGMNVRDALGMSLLAMDYEKDSYNTPRIAAVVEKEAHVGYLGIVRHDALLVRSFSLKPGAAYFVATYELNVPEDKNCDEAFSAETAADCCQHVVSGGAFAQFEHPVTSAVALETDHGFDIDTLVCS
jgi:IMP cyclohydrolase